VEKKWGKMSNPLIAVPIRNPTGRIDDS